MLSLHPRPRRRMSSPSQRSLSSLPDAGVVETSAPRGVRPWLVAAVLVVMAVLAASVAQVITRNNTLSWAEAYARVLATVQSDPRVTQATGGTAEVVGEPEFDGTASEGGQLRVVLHGPKGGAVVTAWLEPTPNGLDVATASVRLDGRPKPLTLPVKKAPPPAEASRPGASRTAAAGTGSADGAEAAGDGATGAVASGKMTFLQVSLVGRPLRLEPAKLTVQAGDYTSLRVVNKTDESLVLSIRRPTGQVNGKPSVIAEATTTVGVRDDVRQYFTAPAEPGEYTVVAQSEPDAPADLLGVLEVEGADNATRPQTAPSR